MPNPKRRHSKSRTRQRRAHDALAVPQFYIDKDSGEAKVPHRIDAKTGMYKGRQIIDTKTEE
jgi:large subunit ribosomal protein L32